MLAINDEEVLKWDSAAKQLNDKILVWLLGSVESDIQQHVESITTVAEVWSTVENQFAGKSNKMQATRIMHELLHLKQGSRSVTEYASELKKVIHLHCYICLNLLTRRICLFTMHGFSHLLAKFSLMV